MVGGLVVPPKGKSADDDYSKKLFEERGGPWRFVAP
jgi:hypothetical protein